jgi:hypothetical protein
MADTDPAAGFGPLERSKTALLTTYRPGGEPVGTPVSIAVAGGQGLLRDRLQQRQGQAPGQQRRRHPGSLHGQRQGHRRHGGRAGQAAGPGGAEADRQGLLKPTGGLFWSLVIYRLFYGKKMVLFEVAPVTSTG